MAAIYQIQKIMISKLKSDLEQNTYRYNAALLIFLFVYFGEVLVAARVLHQLSSVERQFWAWWFLISVFQIVPVSLSLLLLIILLLGLLAATYLQLGIMDDLALWVFYLLITVLVANLVKTWRKRG